LKLCARGLIVFGLLSGFLCVYDLALGQKALALETSEEIDTNRPSFMFSPLVVPRGSVQLESGTLYSGLRHGQWAYDIPETQVRVGLLKKTELQLFVPTFFLQRGVTSNQYRMSNLAEIGLKQEIPAGKKLTLAVIASVSAPTGSKQLAGGGGTIPVIRLPYSYALNDKWSFCGMQSIAVLNNGRDTLYQPDVVLSRTIGKEVGVFVEYAGNFTRHHNDVNIIHFGGTYNLSHCQQVDGHFGFGLNETAPSAFVGAGYSVRFDQLAW